MKAEDLKTKTVDELGKLLLDTRKEQFNLRFQRSGGALENTAQMRIARRNIARIKTFLNRKNNVGVSTINKADKKAPVKKAAPKKAPAKKSA
ncbi:MAG: 50S ribosomal protein L29 [Alphaproteobacteria bacterium]|nr:50S ribosomal protein L29 [Alphaproteobacteria bacterium]